MGTTTDKLSYLIGTKEKIAEKIIDLGGDITEQTTFREYTNELQTMYDNAPKVSAEGSNIKLENCAKGKMVIQPKGNTELLLPDEYQQVEYIESTGTQYIDTDVKCLQTTIFEITNTFNTLSETQLFGAFANSKRAHYGTKSGQIYIPTVTNGITADHIFSGDIQYHTYYLSTSQYKYDDTIIASGNFEFPTNYNFFLFARNNEGTVSNYCKSRLKKAKIYNNNTLIRNFIPCYRKSDDEIGMYDTVNDVFYTNAGTGTFLKGDDYQTIKNVIGNNKVKIKGKNLWHPNVTFPMKSISSAYSGTIDYDEESQVYTMNGTFMSEYFKIFLGAFDRFNTGDTILVKIEKISGTIDESFIVGGYNNNEGTASWVGMASLSPNQTSNVNVETLARAGMTYAVIWTSPSGRTTTANNFKFRVLLAKTDDTATPYEPYIEPIEKELNLKSKNLFNIKSVTWGVFKYYSDNAIKTINVANAFYKYQTVIPKEKISISIKNSARAFRASYAFIDENDNVLSGVYKSGSSQTQTFKNLTVPTNASQILISQIDCMPTDEIEIQLEKGSTPTEYEPYYNYELCKIGNNQDYIYKNNNKWYGKKEIDKIESYNGETITTQYVSTTGGLDIGATIYYVLNNPIYIEITEETLINQLESLNRTIIQVPTIIIETESEENKAQLIVNTSALKSS